MNFSDAAFLKRLVSAAFPGYRGRKISAQACNSGKMSTISYWDGGSRDQFVFVNLSTFETKPILGINPINPPANWRDPTVIPEGFCIVEHSIFCGKDVGCRVHYLPVSKIS